ncbi:MAG: hypothetical protein PUB04_01055 [Clostridia bacterium]|nr:hypothetical protein [Clostridia bacterium]
MEYYGADVSITTSRKVDVALSVGITGTAYNQFKEDLTKAIRAKSPSFDLNNLNIMSATSVNTSGQSSFSWMQFDHSDESSIYNNNTFIEYVGNQSSNEYNDNNNHIVSESNGTKLTFYGYGSGGYSDFMLLENDQQTNKKFQFAIKEYFAADALYGTGFFFNCNMNYNGYSTKEAAYNAQKLLMSGYLAVLEYDANSSGATTTGLYIYKFTNLNLYKFHTQSNGSVTTGLTAAGATVSLLTSVGTGTIKKSDDLRKIIIDVSPKKLKIYYAGFDDTSHNGTVVTTQVAADKQVFSTSNAGYKSFAALTFDKLAKYTPIVDISLPDNFGGSDFGPMTKYGSHNCSKMTKVEMSELSMSMDVVKSLSETLREPNWTDGADKFLVNLNEDPIEDFDNVSVTAELLNRLKNDDIYYIGWCGKDNSSKSYDFLQKNDLRGSVISVDSSDTATDSSGKKFYIGNYTAQINAIADCILGRYANSTSTGDIMLLSDVMFNKNIVIKKADSSDTADSEWPDGKWRIDYYDNYKAKDDDSAYKPKTTWMSDFQCDFDKCGVYKIYYNYEEGDEPVKVISIHDAPIVTIDAAITTSNSTGTATLTALVDYTNQAAGKSYTYKWSYKNLGTASSPISNPVAVDAGTERTAGISNMTTGAVYIVTLEVTDDLFGYTVITSKQITYIASSQTQKTPPTAFFSLEQSNILMKSGQSAEVVITDSSYDPAGAAITGRTYKLYKVTGGVAEKTGTTITVTNGKYTVPASTVSGEYAIGLVVTSANGTSSEMKRNFNVVNDTTAPTVEFSIGKGTLTLDNSQTTMTFNDEGGSGYKGYKYYVSTSSETPTSGQWSVMSSGNEKTVTFPMMNGSYYVHYQIEDNAGNITTNYEGPFVRDQILNTPDNLAFAEGDSPVLTWNGDDRINDTDKASYTVTIYKNGKVFDEIKGLTDNKYIAANIVRGGDGTYSYTVQTLNSGNADASSDTVKYISGQISDMSPELVYVKPQESGVNGGNLNLDEGATQDKIDEVFQGHATLVSDAPLEIMLNSDIKLKETLVISNNIIINLNGHTIKGPDGTKESPDGKPALEVASDNVKIILRGEGKVIGGNGYSDSEGGNGGDGGSGITFGDTEGGSLVIGEDTTVQGGEGGQSTEGVGGDGGSGVEGNDIDATIGGDLLGGDGGDGATKGGDGGSGIETTGDSNIKVKEDAEIGGGNGGDGSTGGNGGSGINSEGGSAEIESGSNIKGGAGGDGSTGDGGAGGNGVETTDSDVDNRGNVSGGDGGSSTGGSGGNGGNAYDTEGGNVNNYDGDTTGGNSGTDTGEGSQKPQDGQTNNSTGKANGGSINIPDISEDASEEAKQAWAENVKNQLDNAFGENNAGYDPENKKIILYNDVQLENPLEPVSDLTIDLNGHTLTGPDGTRENPDGQPAIKMPDGSNLKVENTSDKEGGIYGGNGYSGQKTGQDGNPENGGNGGDAIQFTGAGTADIGEDVNIKGGNGGNSNGADAGDGGCAIKGSDVDTTIKGSAIGGNGGNGGLTGGNGGTAIDAGDGTVDFGEECKLAGGNGGSGDTGGNGGNALDYSNPDADVSIPENADVSGGKGGTSVNGNTAKDGESSDNTFKPAGGVISNPVTQENLDTVFGPGAAEYDEDTNTIKLNKDVELGDTVVLDNDINIDLNGHTLKGTDGTTESPDAKPALKVNGDTEVTITDSSEDGNGQVIGGNGADVSSEDAAGNGAPAVDISGNGTVNIDKDVNIIGGNGGDNTTGPAGNGGSAVNVSPGSSLNADGDITGGDGGYSSKGNGGDGGSAVSGSGADININGNATGGDGGNSNNAEAEAGKGGNVVDGDQTSLNMNGGAIPGNGGTNKKDSDNPGAGGAVSDVTPVTYNVVTELERLNYSGNDTVELNTTFEAQLISVLGNNRYASLPDSIEIKINNVETVVEVIDRAFESEETFEYVVYSKTDGSIYIPAAYVKGSIYIKANLVVVTSCTVSTEEELKDAADAAVGTVTLGDDISIRDEISIQNNTTVDAGEYDITVEEGGKLSNAGKITGTGDINNKGTVENTGKLNPTVRNEGIVKNSGNGDVADLIDLGGTVDNTATVNARHIAVWYVANNGTDDIHEELISEGEGYDVWVNTFKNGTRYFVEWNTREDGTGDKYDRKQIVADENVEYIVLYAIWSEEDAGAKIGDTYYKDLKEALEWSEEGDTVELEKDSDVTENITIPDNVTVDTKGNDINIAEDVVLTVDGKLDVTENGTVTNNGVVDISESGSVENESGSTFNNKGNVNNDGTFNNNEGSTLNNESGAEIGGNQPISNGGDINNDGNIKTTVENTEDGRVDAEVTWTDKDGNEHSGSLKDVLEYLKENPEEASGAKVELNKDVEVTEPLEVPSGVELSVPEDKTFSIGENGKLSVDEGAGLSVEKGGSVEIKPEGTLDNNGTVSVGEGGSLDNDGTVNNNECGTLKNDGTVNNNNVVNNNEGGKLENSGNLNNNNELNNDGNIANAENGKISNGAEASISGAGALDNDGTVNSEGTIGIPVNNSPTATLDAETSWTDEDGKTYTGSLEEALKSAPEGSTIEFIKDIELDEDITVPEGVTLKVPEGVKLTISEDANVTVPEESALVNDGILEVAQGGKLNNDGSVNNSGNLINSGDIINTGEITNNGKIENTNNTINDGKINNNGNIVNTSSGVIAGKGDVDNDGIIGNDGDIAVSGTVTGTENMSGSGSVAVNMDKIVISKDNDTSIESSVNAKVGKGEITIIVESVDKDNNKSDDIIYDVKIGSAYDFIKSAIGTKGLESLKESDNIYLKFTVVKIADKVEKEQETPIKEVVDSNSNADSKMVIGAYVDISYEIKTNNGTWGKLTELNNEIEVTIQIPEDIKGKSTYYIIRNHDGVCDILEDIDDNPDTITFKTDRFSTYAIVYDEPVESVKTGDNNGAAMALYMIMMLMAAGCAVYAGRKKFSR